MTLGNSIPMSRARTFFLMSRNEKSRLNKGSWSGFRPQADIQPTDSSLPRSITRSSLWVRAAAGF